MRLESAMFNSRSGIDVHGRAITVISDNISNGETTGFKAGRAEFGDLYASFSGIKDGGVISTGTGAKVSTVRPIFSNGDIIDTGRNLDLAIGGNGFFVTGTAQTVANASAASTGLQYTRAGNFQLDSEGYLVTSDGRYVYGIDPANPPAEGANPNLTRVQMTSAGVGATPTTAATLSGNLTSSAEIKADPGAAAFGSFNELAGAASVIQNMEVYDSLGQPHDVTLAFFRTENGRWTAKAYADGGDTTGGTAGQPRLIGSVNLTFNTDGTIDEANQAGSVINATAPWTGGAAPGAFTINLASYTQYATQSTQSSSVQNGVGAGQITSYSFDKDGKIFAQMSNGQILVLSQLQTATFQNIDGLTRVGGNSFEATGTTGAVAFGNPASGARGIIRGGALERSTTDMSNSFVDLVTIQRGYQANSQMMTAANELLQQTIAMIR
jgi:flagellar hook protein FlgE